jgi:hypothetical protein
MNGKMRGKSDEQEPRRRYNVINICVRETEYKGVDWIQQALVKL